MFPIRQSSFPKAPGVQYHLSATHTGQYVSDREKAGGARGAEAHPRTGEMGPQAYPEVLLVEMAASGRATTETAALSIARSRSARALDNTTLGRYGFLLPSDLTAL
jgi:hypothetical protein